HVTDDVHSQRRDSGRRGEKAPYSLMLKEFRQFILRGNLVDLAVAVVVGTAFTALVNSLVKAIFTPLIAAVFGKQDFSNLTFTINGSRFLYGAFINSFITFMAVAAVMFF